MREEMNLEQATLALADGTVFRGVGIGKGVRVGEVVFNTSMYGYQEILTDPSYAGQLITFTYPHIGNVGCNADDDESDNIALQIQSLHLRIILIKYMQAFGVLAFLFCVLAMLCLLFDQQSGGETLFIASLVCMVISLTLSLTEIMKSGHSLKIELKRTQNKTNSN